MAALAACQPVETELSDTPHTTTVAGEQRPLYTVADVLGDADTLTRNDVWVAGYVVGYTYSSISNAIFSANGARQSNILLSVAPDDTQHYIPVELATDKLHREVSLAYNPDSLCHAIMVKGRLAVYYGVPGVRDVTSYYWLGNPDWLQRPWQGDNDEEEHYNSTCFPIAAGTVGVYPSTLSILDEGHGTEAMPYLPSQLVEWDAQLAYTWTYGYVTGYCAADGRLCFTATGATDDNVLLSNSPTCTDADSTVVVQLLDSAFIEAVSLRRHPERLGHRIRFSTGTHACDAGYPHYTLLAPPDGKSGDHTYTCDWLDL